MRFIPVLTFLALALCLSGGCGGKQTPQGGVSEEQAAPITQSPVAEMPAPATPLPATDTAVPALPMVTEEQAGFPLYPGATVTEAIPEEQEEGASVRYMEVHFTTHEGFDKVAAFYRGKFPEAKVTSQLDTPALKVLQLEWVEDSGTETVIVTRDQSSKTNIVLAHKGTVAQTR